MELPINIGPEIRELINAAESRLDIEANTYRTRSVRELTLNGKTEKWHSVKGGMVDKSNKELNDSVMYEILFSPENNSWLKIVPTEATPRHAKIMEDRLRKNVEISKAALDIVGLQNLAAQLEDGIVTHANDPDEQGVYGYISPHIGPSLEFFLTQLNGQRVPAKVPEDVKSFFEEAYAKAFYHAVKLYTQFGYWTADPNPGNILLHQVDETTAKIVLIDFTNRVQQQDHLFPRIPKDILEDWVYQDKVILGRRKKTAQLSHAFRQNTDRLGIDFRPDHRNSPLSFSRKS